VKVAARRTCSGTLKNPLFLGRRNRNWFRADNQRRGPARQRPEELDAQGMEAKVRRIPEEIESF